MVAGMSDEQIEPGHLTERFRAFAHSVDPEPSRTPQIVLVAAGAAVLLVAIAIIVWLVLAR